MKRSIHSMKEWECESGETHTVAASEQVKDRPKEVPETPPAVGPGTDGEGDTWDHFVQDNWAPVLENAFGCSWRDKYPEEITAILWWAVKQRNREAGTPASAPTDPVAGSMPQVATPQGLPVGMGPPPMSTPGLAPTSAALIFGTFRPQQIGDLPAQAASGEVQMPPSQSGDGGSVHFGLQQGLAEDMAFVAKDALPPVAPETNTIPVIPLDAFDSNSELELPDLGDVAFANDDEDEPEGPASKRCNLDLSLNLEPIFGDLTLGDDSKGDGNGAGGMIRPIVKGSDGLDRVDDLVTAEEEYDPEHRETERASVQRSEMRRKVKRMGLHQRQATGAQTVYEAKGSVGLSPCSQMPQAPPASVPSQVCRGSAQVFPVAHALPQGEGGRLFGMPATGLEVPCDAEQEGFGGGRLGRGTQAPLGSMAAMGGFMIANPARCADLKSIKFGTFASSNLVHQGRPMLGPFPNRIPVPANGRNCMETGCIGAKPAPDSTQGTVTSCSLRLQPPGVTLPADVKQEAGQPQQSQHQTVSSPFVNGQSELPGPNMPGVLEGSKPALPGVPQFMHSTITPMSFGMDPTGGLSQGQGAATAGSPVFHPTQLYGMYGCGLHPPGTAAWGVTASGSLPGNGDPQRGAPVVAVPAPMLCVPSTLPVEYGMPVPVLSLNQSGQPSGAGSAVQGAVSMPAMYVMESRVASHHIQQIIDGRDGIGRAPVHVAAVAGRADIIEQLIYVGCDCSAVLHMDLLGAAHKRQPPPEVGPPPTLPSHPRNCNEGGDGNAQLATGQPATNLALSPVACCDGRMLPDRSHHRWYQGSMHARGGKDTNDIHAGSLCESSRVTGGVSQGSNLKPQGVKIQPFEKDPGMGMVSFKFCNALHLAAYYGHLNVVDLLLSTKRCDPQGTNEHGCTPLHFAANKGHKHIVARLLKVQGIKIDICDVHGRTPLHHGAAQGHAGVVDELWPRGCEIDAADAMGWTALHYAAHAGHTDVVSKLVIAGCPVQKLDNCGYTAGHLAAQGGYADVLERLLHAGYDPDTLGGMTVLHHCGGSTALHMAAAHGHTKVVRQLLCEGSSPSKEDFRGFTALQCAAEGGHLEAFQALLQAGCNPKAHDCCGTTVLHSAASGGNWDIMRNLLDLGCDHSLQTKYGHTALHHAAQGGAQLVARNLLDLGCDIQVTDREGNTPWHAAAEGGNVEVLQLFLDRGCELEARNNAGCTALHCAAKSGSGGAVRALLDKGADIRAVSSESQTALHYSAEMGHDDIVLLLLETLDKCTVNHQDASGLAVLHHTAEQGNKKMVKALVERGADVNLQTKEGCTPLHLATHGQYQGVVEILLENDCDTSIKDSEGCTALHYAAQRSNLPLFNLLLAGCMTGDKDNQGFSLLHYAVEGGNPDIVGTLLFTGAASYDNMDSSSEVVNALHLACKLGHAVVVSYLLKADYRVDTKGPDGCQPLHYAAQGAPGLWGQKEASHHFHVANLLLDAGADPHAVDDKGCNALMYAAGSGELEMVLKLLLLGVDCTRLDMNQWTSLHWAATSGNVNVVSKLIQAGVPVDTVDNRGRLPLHWSAEQGHLGPVTAILKVMLDKKVDVHQTDNEGATAVQLAARHGHAEVVAKLLESGKTKDVKGLTALHLAAQLRMEDVARLLLGMGKCDVNARDADNCTPLHYSAENGCSSIAGMLLDANADVNVTGADGMMPIHKASSEGHYDVVKLLVDKGALVNFCTSTGSTPLHYAGSAGKGDVLKLLVESGCPVNAMSTGNLSCSALYCAASSGQLEAVDLLLQHGAEVDAICTNDCTALHVAASNGHAQVVKRLLEAGADPDLQAANGAAAIHNAVNNLHLEALEMLLTADCDVDIQNSGGNTALHIAASKGSQELVQEILKAGCDVHIKNAKGWQAVQSAASCGFLEVVLLLVAHGAQFKQKGEMDVSKLLCRKSNLKGSYVDGRLRLAEREKHRKTKPMEQAADTPTGTELKERQAQADAAMAELLAEEQKQRAAEEQLAAKRKAKKDKKKKRKDTAKDNRAKNDHTDGMGGGDSNGAVPEDEDKSTFSALDVETIGSMAKLSLSDPPDTMSVAANEREPEQGKVKGCPGKESGTASVQLKEGVKESDKRLHDRLEEGQNPHPSEGSKKKGKGLESGETVGPSSSQGTVKIIRCHSTATPIISVTKNKKAAVHPAGCAESQKRQTRKASSIASSFQERSQDRGKEPVKIKAQRTRHKTGGPQQNDGHQGTLAANGTVVVVRCQKSSTDAASTQPAWVADSAKSDRMQQCTLTTGGCHPSSKPPLRAGQISGQQRQGTPVATGTTARATPAVLVHNLKPKSGVSTTGKEAGHLEVANQAIGSESTPRGSLPPQPAAAAVPESPSIPQVKSRANPWQRPAKSTTDSAAPALQLPVSCAPAAKAGLLRPHAAMQKAQYAEGAGAAVRASACPQAVQANDQSLMHPATQTNAQLVAQSPTVSSQQARSSILPVADTAPTSSDDPAGGRSVQVCQPPAAWCHTGVSSESGSAQGGSNSPSQTVRASGNESAGARSADGTQIGDMQGARSWGSPGSMQGVRPIVSAAPAATAWVSPTRQQGMPRPQEPGGSQPVSPRIGLGRTGGHTMGKNQDGEAAQSPEGPRVGTSLSGSSMIPGRSLSVSQDDFPFPGRREVTWGVINTSSQLSGGLIELADDHKTTAMENMHSGLGEPIVPPPVPGHPEFANLSKHQKAFGEDRYAQVQGVPNWGSGHLVEGGYVPGPMHAMYPGAWGQGWAPGPTGHMDAHKGVPTPGGGGAQYAKTPHPAVPNGLPWRVNAPLTSAAADGVLQSDSSTRGSVVNIPDDPWDIGDTEKPEPRVYGQGSPRSMPPVHSVPGRSQFSCPLTNKLMEDPVVAADGFTYERSSIEEWLVQNGKSPMTKQPLLHKELVPNLTMRAAIRLLGPGQK